jgi:signal transduction histidine kinase
MLALRPLADGGGRREIHTAVAQFALAGLAVVVLVGAAGAYLLRDIGTDRALVEAQRATEVAGRGIVEPALSDDLLTGDEEAIARIDDVVQAHVLTRDVIRVKIWSEDGRVLYSDEPRLIGARFPLESEHLGVLGTDEADVEVADLDRPENRYERAPGEIAEVYLGLRTPNGTPVLFEQYLRYGAVEGTAERIWLDSAPVLIVALLLVAAVQVPLAWSMARRLRAGQRAREALLVRAMEASDAERRSIAADLHDGVVQDLAGISFRLAAAAERAGPRTDVGGILAGAAGGLRTTIRQLRTLLLEIHPPNLHDAGLKAALADLAAPVRERGVDVHVSVTDGNLDEDAERLVFRATQEALRNVVAHAEAKHVAVRVEPVEGGAELTVADDGRGFDPAALEGRRREGHVGLVLLADVAREAGARLDVTSEPGRGTRVRLWVPAR